MFHVGCIRRRQAEWYTTVAFQQSMSADRIILVRWKANSYSTFHQYVVKETMLTVDKRIVKEAWGSSLVYHYLLLSNCHRMNLNCWPNSRRAYDGARGIETPGFLELRSLCQDRSGLYPAHISLVSQQIPSSLWDEHEPIKLTLCTCPYWIPHKQTKKSLHAGKMTHWVLVSGP